MYINKKNIFIMSIKEELIKNYINSIDFNYDDWNVNTIKEDLKKIIGEMPAIDIEYEKQVYIDESNRRAKEILKPQKMIIVFMDELDNYKKIEFII